MTIIASETPGLVGIKNLGNTCFLNSALQCLSNLQPLTDYFLSNLHLQEINENNPIGSGGVIVQIYAELIREIWTTLEDSIKPQRFMIAVSKFSKQFGYGTQEDSHEFLAFLLDQLHEDLNRVIKKPTTEDKEDENRSLEEQALDSWKNYLSRNKSVIVDLFQGQLINTLTCLECKHISVKFDPFMYLSVPVPEQDICDLTDCINNFTKEEVLDNENKWFCPKCKDFQRAKKKIGLWKMPNILVVHLKRFTYTKKRKGKINTFVNFRLSDLNLKSSVAGRQKEAPIYDLFGVCNHEGSLGGGHYTAVCKNRESKSWYNFNDSIVRELKNPEKHIVTPSAYMLFYSKTSVDNFRRQTLSRPDAWPHILEERKSSIMNANHFYGLKKKSKSSLKPNFSENKK